MPLRLAKTGKKYKITSIRGKDELIRHLQNLGFVESAELTVVGENRGNLIVIIKDSRIGVSMEACNHIFVEEI